MGLPCQDIQVRNLFKKIAEYRKLWKLQEQEWLKDDESPGDHGDDDCDYVDDNPDASPPPDGSISTPPVLAGVSEGSPEMEAIDTQLAELGIGGGPWPLHKKRSWHPFLLASKKWRSDPIRRAYLIFHAWASYQIKILVFVSQQGRITCATQPSQVPCFNRGFQAWNVPEGCYWVCMQVGWIGKLVPASPSL